MPEPKVCISENLTVDELGRLRLQPWSVPRLVADVVAGSSGDGSVVKPETALPGKLMIDRQVNWVNDSPVDQMVLIRVTRPTRAFLTSNPNAIQFRDRWTWKLNGDPTVPIVTGIHNSQMGGAIDVGTNTVAEPNPGRLWVWMGAHSVDEWVGPIGPDDAFKVWYRCYMWTPPPFSDNANKNNPQHIAIAGGVRIQLMAFPQQGELVVG